MNPSKIVRTKPNRRSPFVNRWTFGKGESVELIYTTGGGDLEPGPVKRNVLKDTFIRVDDLSGAADVIGEDKLNTSTRADDPSGVAYVITEEEEGPADVVEATLGTD